MNQNNNLDSKVANFGVKSRAKGGAPQIEVETMLLDFKQEMKRFAMVDQLLLLRLRTEFHNLQETFDSQWLDVCRKVRKYKNSVPRQKGPSGGANKRV